jgi:hypothetical protein
LIDRFGFAQRMFPLSWKRTASAVRSPVSTKKGFSPGGIVFIESSLPFVGPAGARKDVASNVSTEIYAHATTRVLVET